MSKKGSIRDKRFVLTDKKKLKALWSANNGQLLELSYDYSSAITEASVYRELIEVAVENFNRLGLARLQHRRITMGVHLKTCPFDGEYLKTKHKNPIIFSESKNPNPKDTVICYVKNNRIFYDPNFTELFIDDMKGDNVTLPPFSEIICNTVHKNFQRLGVGVILHEINHLFGVKHSHSLEETNGILSVNISKPDLNSIPKGEFSKMFNLFSYDSFLQVTNYTPISLFSIQHYRVKALMPYRAVNETRINEVLDSYHFLPEIKLDFFYLLEKYAGFPILYIYQDIAGLATAIYHMAPDSLIEKTFNFPNYFLIDGIYLPKSDRMKLDRVVNALFESEQFEYPILAQENVTISIRQSQYFTINLRKSFKIVNLSKQALCQLAQGNLTHLFDDMTLRSDCWLSGKLELSGTVTVPIIVSKELISSVHFLQLLVERKHKNIKTRVLLGKSSATFFTNKTTYVNIIDVCQAVALPLGKKLNCRVASENLALDTHLERCWYFLELEKANHSFSFIISNGAANKTCDIQFLFNQTFSWEDKSLVNLSDNALNDLVGEGRYAASIREYLTAYQLAPSVTQVTQNAIHPEIFLGFSRQFNYCVTIPFIHGILEGGVDSSSLPVYIKSALKLLPRIGLWYFNYLNLLGFGLLCITSFLEGVLKNSVGTKVSESVEKFIHVLVFLSMTELEYGFSNLWLLADKLQFWPALSAKLNQLFLQVLFVPMVKTCGYAISLNFIKSILMPIIQEVQGEGETEAPLLSGNNNTLTRKNGASCSFFSALCTASRSVFSSKTIRLFSFFSNTDRVQIKQKKEVAEQENQLEGWQSANKSFAKAY